MLDAARTRWPNLRFAVQGAGQQRLLRYLKEGEVDVVVTLLPEDPGAEARHVWTEELAWVRGKKMVLDLDAPIPLVSYKDGMRSRIAIATLARANLVGELVFCASDAHALHSAVKAGLGVKLISRRRIPADLQAWDDGPLPPPPPVYGAVFVREDIGDSTVGLLADSFAAALRPDATEVVPFPSPHAEHAKYH
jgi:DNA-binding transcriptional LysR family regulator